MSTHPIIHAFDLATTTGWALTASGIITSGSQCFARHPGNKSRGRDHLGASHGMFDNWLREQLREPRPTEVVYEQAGFFKSAAAVQICVGFRGILLAHCAKLDIPVFSYSPTSVKKFWAGKGNADKDDMVAATLIRCPGIDLTDDNEADSLALLHLHMSLRLSVKVYP
jgi:Holliday junction resolvasome RuvABC endonuclease subunit